MMVDVCVCLVLLTTAALIGAKAAREVLAVVWDVHAKKPQTNAQNEQEKRKAERNAREINNFMTYNGKAQEDVYED